MTGGDPGRFDAALRACLGPADGAWNTRAGLRDAAILAPLFRRDGVDHLLLTLRRDDLPDHPGQVAFPGGAREGDEDAVTCALRETREEIGLDAAAAAVLGRLPDRVSIAGFLVAAFPARVPEPRDLRHDAREVERILEFPVPLLREEARWRVEDRVSARGTFRDVPFFDWDGPVLWGLTALFVRDLLGRME